MLTPEQIKECREVLKNWFDYIEKLLIAPPIPDCVDTATRVQAFERITHGTKEYRQALSTAIQALDELEKKEAELERVREACREARDYLRYNKGNASPIFDKLQSALKSREGGKEGE